MPAACRWASRNASLRWGDGLLISPTGTAYAQLRPEHIVYLDADGNCPAGQLLPSSEWRIHCDILRAFPACEAVVHVHSTHATALACLGQEIPPFHYMVAMAGGARIPCADYATFGTPELSANVLRALDGGLRACLMANHGQVAAGESLADALALAEEVENMARRPHPRAQPGTHPRPAGGGNGRSPAPLPPLRATAPHRMIRLQPGMNPGAIVM